MLRPPCLRPPTSPPAPHGHDRPGSGAAGASAATPAGPPAGDAPRRPAGSGEGKRVGDAGASDGDARAGAGSAGPACGAGRPSVQASHAAAVGGSAGAPGHPADGSHRGASTERIPSPPAHAGQRVAPRHHRQRLRPPQAPMCPGTSPCPAPFGRTPGRSAEPAAGFIFARPLPVGNPRDASDVPPLVEQVQPAIARVATRPTPAIHALAGSEPPVRVPTGVLTVGIPHGRAPPPVATPGTRVSAQDGCRGTPCPGIRTRVARATVVEASWPACVPGAAASDKAARRDRHRDGHHGAPRRHVGPPPRVASVETGTHVPPPAALERPSSQSMPCLHTLVVTTYTVLQCSGSIILLTLSCVAFSTVCGARVFVRSSQSPDSHVRLHHMTLALARLYPQACGPLGDGLHQR